ncbi:MAG: serine hydrolase [Balneolaceae bacterium]|nr:serine hydrolase [Balneolaceae bacterium]MCH8548102.1 class A beta-lactamase-related serine hydrolase [Balneolaceae bacterium]
MTLRYLFILPILIILMIACTQDQHDRSEIPLGEISSLVESFNGVAGVYVKDLETGTVAEVNADTVFPTASMVKVPIMVKIFDLIEKGELGYRDDVEYGPEPEYEYSGDIIAYLEPGTEISIAQLIHLMMSVSNNTGSLWLQHLAGSGTAINEKMAELGLENTRVNSRTDGRSDAFSQYGWGQTTPKEMATLVEGIYRGEIVSPHASEQMYRIMTRNYWDHEAMSIIPPTVQVASKNGSVRQSKSEVVLVNGPSGDYLFSVVTKNQEDTRNEYDNEGWVLIREVSRILYDHFEPDSDWTPDEEREQYW